MRLRGVTFVGLGGYGLPHTRVRCYHFATGLGALGFRTRVYSFKDRLKAESEEAQMYRLTDKEKLALVARAVPSLLRRPRDLLYLQKAHYHAASVLALHRLARMPFVLDYDDYELGADPFGVPLHCGFRRSWVQRRLLGGRSDSEVTFRLAGKARGCVVASTGLQKLLEKRCRRVLYLPTGVDTERFRPALGPDAGPVFVWTGLAWGQTVYEGLRTLSEAFQWVRNRVPTAELLVVGGGSWMPRFRQMARGCPGLTVMEEKAPTEMPDVLTRAAVGVLPPLPDSPWSASKSPTKLFEYMSAGLAVVAWDGGEARQVVREGTDGFLVTDGRALADAMLAVARDGALRRRLGDAARKRAVACYSLSVLTNRLGDYLRSLGVERS